MSIIRIQKDKDNPYFIINRKTVCDDRLSWKATGLLAYFLSLPDDWQIHFAEIILHKTDGKKAVRSGFAELLQYGYMTRTAIRDSQGKITDWNYTVFESPQFQDSPLTQNGKVDMKPLTPFQEVDNGTPLINKYHQLITSTTNSPQPEKTNIYEILKNDFNQDTPIARETVDRLIEKYGVEDTKEAMKRAIIQGVAKLSYVIGILKSGLNTPKEKRAPGLDTRKVSDDNSPNRDYWPVR